MLVRLDSLNDFAEWRSVARALLIQGVAPQAVEWADPAKPVDRWSATEVVKLEAVEHRKVGRVPPKFLRLAPAALCHTDPGRFGLLYSLLWRMQKHREVLFDLDDTDVGKLNRRVEAVLVEFQRMKEGLRFRRAVSADGHKGLIASFEPKHYVLERVAPHFTEAIAGEDWVITTPYRSAFWDGKELTYGEGRLSAARAQSLLRNLSAPPIIAVSEPTAEEEMAVHGETHDRREARRSQLPPPEPHEDITSLAEARAEVQGCRRCPLFEHATQAVFGEGPERANIMFVGEQPGDQEDLQGKPFVGPAGKLFDKALERVGIDRRKAYVTNAVKHFKFVPRGKRRLHQRPNSGEITACRFWLELEREFVKPKVIVALGATAVQSLLGRTATITSLRGKPIDLDDGTLLYVTIHPSYLLRIRDDTDARAEERAFEADLKKIKALAGERADA
jgi:probable DNA metabolism protein